MMSKFYAIHIDRSNQNDRLQTIFWLVGLSDWESYEHRDHQQPNSALGHFITKMKAVLFMAHNEMSSMRYQ